MKDNFHRKVLDNGMTILFEKRGLPVVSVGFAVRVGGINESAEEKGISHFIEHLLYKGTKKRTSFDITSEIERNGGELNGVTDEEITAYYCKMPSEGLKIALEVLGDIVRNSVFDEKELDKERKVIFEELKMRKDNPRIYALDQIEECLYEEPFGSILIGTEKTMNSLDRNKLVEKFKKVYTPNNLILCVVGDADFEEVVKFAEDNFGNEKGDVPELKIKMKNESKVETRESLDQANLIFAYHVPVASDKKSYAAEVLNCLLAGGMSSRLFNEIREKRNLAYGVKGEANINSKFAYNVIYVGTTKENVELVKNLILEEFEKVASSLEESEMNEVKKQLIGNFHISMEDSHSQMLNLFVSEIQGNAENFYDFDKNISEVKLEDVKELAKRVVKNYSFFALVPGDKS